MSRRHRPSLPTSPAGADDISNLTLVEVRDRLKRNERVLNGGLFGPALAGSAGHSAGLASASPFGSTAAASPSSAGCPGFQGSMPLPPAFSPSPRASPGAQPQSAQVGQRAQAQGQGYTSGSVSAPLPPAFANNPLSGAAQVPTTTTAGPTPTGTSAGSQSPALPMGIAMPQPTRSPAHTSFFASPRYASGSGSASTGTSPTNAVRDRLLAVRQALLEREAQLVLAQASEGMEEMDIQDAQGDELAAAGAGAGATARRRSSALSSVQGGYGVDVKPGLATSGKRLAMERMMEQDKTRPKNSLILPVAQTFHLAAREFDAETAAKLNNLMIGHTQSSSPKPRRTRPVHSPYQGQAGPGAAGGKGDAGRYPDSPTSRRTPQRGSGMAPRANAGAGGMEDGDEIDRAHYLARLNSFMRHRDPDDDEGFGDGDYGFDGADDDDNNDEDRVEQADLEDADPEAQTYFLDGLSAGAGLARGSALRGRGGNGLAADGIFDLDEADDDAPVDYAGDDDRLDLGLRRDRMEPGTGEEIDSEGEDDERFKEGNEDYTLGGGDGDAYMG